MRWASSTRRDWAVGGIGARAKKGWRAALREEGRNGNPAETSACLGIRKRTEGSGLRANYLRTLLGSGQTGSGANREAATRAADRKGSGVDRVAAAPAADCRRTALGLSELGRNRGEDHGSTAGPERGDETQLRAWAVAPSGGGAVPGRASGAHMGGSARRKRLQERAQEGRVSPASTSQQQQAGLALAATGRSGLTATRR